MATITLKTFTAALRHGGNLLHEIPIEGDYAANGKPCGISERELRFLKSLHGGENIINVKEVGTVEVDEREHYFHIAERYGSHEDFTRQDIVKQRVEKLFSVELDGFHEWLSSKMEDKPKVSFQSQSAADAERIRAETTAQVEADVAKSLNMSVEELRALRAPQAAPVAAAQAA